MTVVPAPAPAASAVPDTATGWLVMIVDDDPIAHRSIEIALMGVQVEGRPLQFLHAHSAAEALALATAHPALAVALVDVVMESPDAGLQLVGALRALPQREALRIVLRTGQPGYAPELETFRQYDIDDYWNKLDATRTRLVVGLTAAIRAHRQFVAARAQRDHLAAVNAQLIETIAAERQAHRARGDAERALAALRGEVEQEIEARTRELVMLAGSMEQFNQMVAHDLRGPLDGVAKLVELVDQRLDAGEIEQARRWIGMIGAQTRRLAELVQGLLELSTLSGEALQRRHVELRPLVQEAIDQVRLQMPQQAPRTDYRCGALPALEADPTLMRQVLINLIGNATKFSRDAAAPRVDIDARVPAGGGLVVTVRDNGVGFEDEASAQRLFQPFVRLHDRRFEGNGIGLVLVRRIVELHGGSVFARPAPGGGALFGLCFDGATPDGA